MQVTSGGGTTQQYYTSLLVVVPHTAVLHIPSGGGTTHSSTTHPFWWWYHTAVLHIPSGGGTTHSSGVLPLGRALDGPAAPPALIASGPLCPSHSPRQKEPSAAAVDRPEREEESESQKRARLRKRGYCTTLQPITDKGWNFKYQQPTNSYKWIFWSQSMETPLASPRPEASPGFASARRF